MKNFLQVHNLKVQLGGFLLDVPNLTVDKGAIHVLQGPSGSGKSTLLHAIAGFEACTSGEIQIGDRRVTSLYPEERNIGYVFQENALFPHYNVLENTAFGLKVRGVPLKERSERASQWLKRVGLSGFESRRVQQISGGEAQRVQLARALICGFQVLLLDEPFSSLDVNLKQDLRGLLKDLVRETEVACLLVSHDKEDVQKLANEITELENGKVIRSEKVPIA